MQLQPTTTASAAHQARVAAAEQILAAALAAFIDQLAELRPGLRLAIETLVTHGFDRTAIADVLAPLQLGPATYAAALATVDQLLEAQHGV